MRLFEIAPGRKERVSTGFSLFSSSKYPKYLSLIQRDCTDAIAIMKHQKAFIYRGVNGSPNAFVSRSRENRRSLTYAYGQSVLDKILVAAGFTAIRSNSIFCSADSSVASTYGNLYFIFPKNGFEYSWSSKFRDSISLTHKIEDKLGNVNTSITDDESFLRLLGAKSQGDQSDSLSELFRIATTDANAAKRFCKLAGYTNSHLDLGLESHHEIMIRGEYYAIRYSDKLHSYFDKELFV